MANYFSREKNVQIILSLLKKNGIKKIVASPGATNVAFVGSVQNDPYFEVYSSVDERSSAYIACGLAEESGEAVVISCTGATASRNYLPGLTEAFYRKLPVLAITSSQPIARVGHHVAQVIDRSTYANDVVKRSFQLPIVTSSEYFWECEVKVNQAIIELFRRGGGPVHLNLPTVYDPYFDVKKLPRVRAIKRYGRDSVLPELKGKVAVFIGAHKRWKQEEEKALEQFCENYGAAVFCDHTSGFKGKNRLQFSLAAGQECFNASKFRPDVAIHIGEVSGDYHTLRVIGGEVWRVSEDGEIRDTFRRMRCLFDMPEHFFFKEYSKQVAEKSDYYEKCRDHLTNVKSKVVDLPFSNIWVAKNLANNVPHNSVVHLGILNSLRSWNFFELPYEVSSSSNTGGFGIDGVLSTLLGASLVNKEKIYYCVIGDLAFFYDMNALGNRHVSNNLRVLLVNNGKGTEFTNHGHHASRFGKEADEFIAATGHFGEQSKSIVRNYAENLGFDYMSASDKKEFYEIMQKFVDPSQSNRPMLFEVFTKSQDESDALKAMVSIDGGFRQKAKLSIKKLLKRKEFSFLLPALKRIIK